MKGRRFILFVFAALTVVGCGQGKKAEQFKALPFPDTVPPGMMTEPRAQLLKRAEMKLVNSEAALMNRTIMQRNTTMNA